MTKTQEAFRRDQYIEACITKAQYEAAAFYDQHLVEAKSDSPGAGVAVTAADDDEGDVLTCKQASAELGVSERTVRRYVSEGKLTPVKNMLPRLNFRRKTIERFKKDR